MKKFLIHIALYLACAYTTYLVVLSIAVMINPESVDAYYYRLTKRPSGSLVLGTSRAAQGLEPEFLEKALPDALPFYNLSFMLISSPYGQTYLDYIKRNTEFEGYNENRVFIFSVDPWCLRQEKGMSPGDFAEKQILLGKLKLKNHEPNLEYLLRYVDKPLTNAVRPGKYISVTKKGRTHVDFDQDWLDKHFESRLQFKMSSYRNGELYKNGERSEERLSRFKQTVEYLSEFGTCYMVRMPSSREFLDLENDIDPDFSLWMTEVSNELKIPFLDYSEDYGLYQTTDGNHLHLESGNRFSETLGVDINNLFSK